MLHDGQQEDDNTNLRMSGSDDDDDDADHDFLNRADAIDPSEWDRLDNLTCVSEGLPIDLPSDDWLLRAPRFLIIGAMKAGTTALNTYLSEHSKIIPTKRKEVHFFDYKFSPFATPRGILRASGRQRYRRMFHNLVGRDALDNDPKIVSFDDSPKYLFLSDVVPARVFCVAPWVKLIAILRNPIDRAFSQFMMKYNGNIRKHHPLLKITFEEWIEKDMQDLRNSGVVQTKIPADEFAGSNEEALAWKTYNRLGTHAPIGRGLYALQLRQWFKAMQQHGKNQEDMLIIHSEEMKTNTEEVYEKTLRFLDMDIEPLVDNEEKFQGKYTIDLKPETRERLLKFYEPYNRELYGLLGDDWDGVWDS